MTAFCVFGVSMESCRSSAMRTTPEFKNKRALSQQEWLAEVEKNALALFEAAKTGKQISPAFDAPKFCEDWLEVAARSTQTKLLKIMCRGQKVDKKGAPKISKKNKAPMIGWIPYESEAA